MARPIVILAFSNYQAAHLPYLEEEADKLSLLFHRQQAKGLIDLRFYPNVSLDELTLALRSLRRRVMIFHYAGHAKADSIELQSGSMRLGPIAHLLTKYWKPNLVFLNGCSTSEMGKNLIEAGVKGVISTERPVGDRKAKNFAINFYENLLLGQSVADSFEFATSLFQADGNPELATRAPDQRHLQIGEVEPAHQGFPWKLEIHPTGNRLRGTSVFQKRGWGQIRINYRIPAAFVLLGLGIYFASRINWKSPEQPSKKEIPLLKPSTELQEDSVPPASQKTSPFHMPCFRFEDQTGAPLQFNAKKGFQLLVGQQEINLNHQWSLKDELKAHAQQNPQPVYLSHHGRKYSDPNKYVDLNQVDTVSISTKRVILWIEYKFLLAQDAPFPSHFFLVSEGKDSLRVDLPTTPQTDFRDTILVPFSFPTEGEMTYAIEPPYEIMSDYCLLMQEFKHRNTPCRIRIRTKSEVL